MILSPTDKEGAVIFDIFDGADAFVGDAIAFADDHQLADIGQSAHDRIRCFENEAAGCGSRICHVLSHGCGRERDRWCC